MLSWAVLKPVSKRAVLNRAEPGWTGLDRAELGWTGLDQAGPGWTGLDRDELG